MLISDCLFIAVRDNIYTQLRSAMVTACTAPKDAEGTLLLFAYEERLTQEEHEFLADLAADPVDAGRTFVTTEVRTALPPPHPYMQLAAAPVSVRLLLEPSSQACPQYSSATKLRDGVASKPLGWLTRDPDLTNLLFCLGFQVPEDELDLACTLDEGELGGLFAEEAPVRILHIHKLG